MVQVLNNKAKEAEARGWSLSRRSTTLTYEQQNQNQEQNAKNTNSTDVSSEQQMMHSKHWSVTKLITRDLNKHLMNPNGFESNEVRTG